MTAVIAAWTSNGCGSGETVLGELDGGTDVGTEDAAEANLPETGAEAEAEADGETAAEDGGLDGTLAVLVLGSPSWPDYAWNAVAGSAVAFDRPGGGRDEAVTDATGRVSFDGFDWAAGPAAVTAGLDGFGMASLVELDGTDTEVTLVLPSWADPTAGRVELTLTALNVPVEAKEWNVQACAVGGPATDEDLLPDPLSIWVPTGVPLTLRSFAFLSTTAVTDRGSDNVLLAWRRIDHEPVDGPASIDVDFSGPILDSAKVSGSYDLPARADSPLRGFSPWTGIGRWIGPGPGRQLSLVWLGQSGVSTHVARTATDDAVEYSIEYVDDPGPSVLGTYHRLVRHPIMLCSESSTVYVPGIPAAGHQDFAHLEVPRMLVPSSPSAGHALHDPFAWEMLDPNATPTLHLKRTRTTVGDTDVWWITAPTGATTLTIPQPPRAIDAESLLGTGPTVARVGLRADDEGGGFRVAQGMCVLVDL